MYSVLNKLSIYIYIYIYIYYFDISVNITSYTFVAFLKIVESLKCILKGFSIGSEIFIESSLIIWEFWIISKVEIASLFSYLKVKSYLVLLQLHYHLVVISCLQPVLFTSVTGFIREKRLLRSFCLFFVEIAVRVLLILLIP